MLESFATFFTRGWAWAQRVFGRKILQLKTDKICLIRLLPPVYMGGSDHNAINRLQACIVLSEVDVHASAGADRAFDHFASAVEDVPARFKNIRSPVVLANDDGARSRRSGTPCCSLKHDSKLFRSTETRGCAPFGAALRYLHRPRDWVARVLEPLAMANTDRAKARARLSPHRPVRSE